MNHILFLTLLSTLGTWSVTALGAATVVFFKSPNARLLNLMLGFASGVMIAASFWSLLQPAIERAEAQQGPPAYLVITAGFLSGAVFMWLSDKAVSYAQPLTFGRAKKQQAHYAQTMAFGRAKKQQSHYAQTMASYAQENGLDRFNRVIMLILSITLHNIPEGLAVGVAFGALRDGYTTESLMGAITIATGIGLQNFPEGAAVSIPLRREGFSRKKSFFFGQASGIVEPVAGLSGALLVVYVEAILPFALSFAAGAMILVAVHELIPECQQDQKARPYSATMGIVAGFAVMMLLDVMLG